MVITNHPGRAKDDSKNRCHTLIEDGHADVSVRSRLADRRQERDELLRRRKQLEQEASAVQVPPTANWVAEKLAKLHEVISSNNPAAAVALRELLGSIVVSEQEREGSKRKYLRGTASPNLARILDQCGSEQIDAPESLVFHFYESPPWAAVAADVKKLFDDGLEYSAIAARLRCPRSWPAKALAFWHREQGLPPVDGRSTRVRLKRPTKAMELADQVKALLDQDLLMIEIAEKLGCNKDTATAAIQYWYSSRSMIVPDGRSRRKSLERKSRESGDQCSTDPGSPRPDESHP